MYATLAVLALIFVLLPLDVRAADPAQATADEIRAEATGLSTDPEGRPLPLACGWQCGVFTEEICRGWRPAGQLALIGQGRHLLPWFGHPSFEEVPTDPQDFFFDYCEAAIKRAAVLRLPITFVASQWESGLSVGPTIALPPEENPNVVTVDGQVLPQVCPFGPVEPWREIGRKHTANARMRKLQEWYPDPPLVIFLSNNEHAKLQWTDVEKSQRYMDRYGAGRDDDFKRKVVGDGWIERYRALQEGMRDGLDSPQWKQAACFVGYDAFGPPHFGRWGGWPEYSLHTKGRIDPSPLAWDGGSPSYYTHNWNPSTDCNVWSPQVEFQNVVFMQEEAERLNPRFWLELSIWDGYAPGEANDKRKHYADLGQTFTPERYRGFVQFSLWLLRPRAAREFRGWTQPWDENEPYFAAVMDAVDRVYHPTLRDWWRTGKLILNRAHGHPYQAAIPEEYQDADRWFLLDADVNSQEHPWEASQTVNVFALALTRGEPGAREWLVYAHSPLAEREGVALTIPGYGTVTVDVAVGGSFYEVSEADGTVAPVG